MQRFAQLTTVFAAAAVCLCHVSNVAAGPEWIEATLGNAGKTPTSAQPTGGDGTLGRINGNLDDEPVFGGNGPNIEDMFIINIVSPEQFSATTMDPNGSTSFDSQLWLFTIDGRALLANDDTLESNDGKTGCINRASTLCNYSNDGTNQGIPGPGLYLLAISNTGSVPGNDLGPLFDLQSTIECSGPDGPGGALPFTKWIGKPTGELGPYIIYITGTGMSGLFADIKPGGCPNSHNPGSNGVLPASIAGSGGFDPYLVNPATIVIARHDGVGGEVPLIAGSLHYEDVATPFLGSLCNCHELEGDGLTDIKFQFDSELMRSVLLLDQVPGNTLLTLVIRGEFVDGTPFGARDCIRIVPPLAAPNLFHSGSKSTTLHR